MSVILEVARGERIRDFCRLLFEEYCLHLKWHDAAKFPDGVFTDEHDSEAVFLTISSPKKLLGGLRVVRDSPKGFPHEHLLPEEVRCDVLSKNRSTIWEVTRFAALGMVKRTFTLEAIKCLYWFGRDGRVEKYFTVVDMNLFLICHKLSVPLRPVWLPIYCEGSWTVPSILVPRELEMSLKTGSPDLWKYISDPSNLLGDWS